jgi:hypothetical protein
LKSRRAGYSTKEASRAGSKRRNTNDGETVVQTLCISNEGVEIEIVYNNMGVPLINHLGRLGLGHAP